MALKIKSFTYVPTYNGDEGVVMKYQEASSQTFVKGDLVVINAAGDISLATAGAANQIAGIALAPATNVTSNKQIISVQLIRPFDLFCVNYVSGTTFTIAMIGENHEIVRTSAGNWEVASGTTAADARVKVIGSPEYNAGGALAATSGGPIYVRFLQADTTPDQVLQFSTDASF